MTHAAQLIGTVLVTVSVVSTPALAQPAPLSPLEIGIGVDAADLREGLYLDEALLMEPMLNVRVTKPLTTNVAFEATFALGQASAADYDTRGFYTLQVKHCVWAACRRDVEVFVTYGAAGVWRQDRIPRPNGSDLILDAVMLPLYAVAGVGLQWKVADRAAVRSEIQGVGLAWAPVGWRVSTGLSIPFSPYRS